MHYSWVGFVYQAMAWLGQRLAEKLFDIVLVALGTWCGYWFAKRHLEHFVSETVKKIDAKYLDLNRQMAFQRAVTAMLPGVRTGQDDRFRIAGLAAQALTFRR